jgi:HSP20 family molecular chaperone IbpA
LTLPKPETAKPRRVTVQTSWRERRAHEGDSPWRPTRPRDCRRREGRDIAAATEVTRPGVLLTPPVDIFEDSQAITVLADMQGVTPGQ